MNGFIANSGPTSNETISNAPFWPPVDASAVRDGLRIDGSVTDARLRAAIVSAILVVNDTLGGWRRTQQTAGYARLQDTPDDEIGGMHRGVVLYLRAVCCAVGAELAERYRSYDATATGNQRADELTPSIEEFRRDQAWALSDLQRRPRCTVELV